MKAKKFFAAVGVCALISVILVSAIYGVTRLMASDEPKGPEYSPERYACIMEEIVDENGFPDSGRTFLYDVEERKVIDGEFPCDTEEQLFGYVVNTADYERLHAGGFSEEELEKMKGWMAFSLDPAPEVCEIFYNNDGKVIGHHHTVDGKIVEPTKDCGVKIEAEGQSLEGAYHILNFMLAEKKQSE